MSIAYGARQPCDEGRAEVHDRVFPCPKRDKPWVLATAILGSSLAFIESSVVTLALPALQSDLGATSTELQWVINAYLLMLGSFMLIGGSLGDRYGLRRIFMAGAGLFCVGPPCLPRPRLPRVGSLARPPRVILQRRFQADCQVAHLAFRAQAQVYAKHLALGRGLRDGARDGVGQAWRFQRQGRKGAHGDRQIDRRDDQCNNVPGGQLHAGSQPT